MDDNDITNAKKTGAIQGLIFSGIGIILAYLTFSLIFCGFVDVSNAFLWFTDPDYSINFSVGVVVMLMSGYVFGRLSGFRIIIKKRNYAFSGIITGLAVILTTTLTLSCLQFYREKILSSDNQSGFFIYIFDSLYSEALFGIIPSLFLGVWFGWSVKKKGKRFRVN